MNARSVRRAAAIAAVLALAVGATASADSIVADFDAITTGVQGTLNLGPVLPGSTHVVQVPIELACSGSTHVGPGETIQVDVIGAGEPPGGSIESTGASIGPVPDSWPASGASCGATQPLPAAEPATVTITAPLTPGIYADYTLLYYTSSVGNGYASASFSLTVDTPPSLVLPANPVTIEGNVTGGALAAYTVGATDAEDASPPTLACVPAVGAFVALGPTTVRCTAADSAGMTSRGTFELDVVDTSAPILSGLPAPISATTSDSNGMAISYAQPTAIDVVDPAPVVTCSPASGSVFPVATTSVACTATDYSGNSSSRSFDVTVTLAVATQPVAAQWAPPIGTDIVEIRSGRTLPVKVALTDAGQPVAAGDVELALTPLAACPAVPAEAGSAPAGGPSIAAGPLAWQQGVARWSMLLDASAVPGQIGSCTRADVTVDGASAGFFVLRLVR